MKANQRMLQQQQKEMIENQEGIIYKSSPK
jgi:hypothetical protein